MPAFLRTLSIIAAMGLTYLWLQAPLLQPYSLQAFLVAMLLYFVIKRLNRAALWHIAPSAGVWELPVLTFAILQVIGATGTVHSPFYPLSYVYIFFVIMACEVGSSLVVVSFLLVFYFAFTPAVNITELISLSTLPLITVLFLFGKHQYEAVKQDQALLDTEEHLLGNYVHQEEQLITFLHRFVRPKLELLQQLSQYPEHNHRAIQGQLSLLLVEVEKTTHELTHTKPKEKESESVTQQFDQDDSLLSSETAEPNPDAIP